MTFRLWRCLGLSERNYKSQSLWITLQVKQVQVQVQVKLDLNSSHTSHKFFSQPQIEAANLHSHLKMHVTKKDHIVENVESKILY